MTPNPVAGKLLAALGGACGLAPDHGAVRQALDDLGWALLDATLAAADPGALSRCVSLLRRHEEAMSPIHRRVTDAIRTQVGAS